MDEASKHIIEQFEDWYSQAKACKSTDEDAIALSTSPNDLQPNVRIVYFRKRIGLSFCFFSNYLSAKGQEMSANPQAAIVFLWHMMDKQLRIRGTIKPLNDLESEAYFNQRSYESRLSAATSKQSQRLPTFEKFLEEVEEMRKKHPTQVPRPPHWGGYALEAKEIEFWQAGEHRRHKRERFILKNNLWIKDLLYP
jgi:pyridoxamine 5'-phosphate oxidase